MRTYRKTSVSDAAATPTQTLNLPEFRLELRVQIQKALHAPSNTVTLIRPPPGSGKTFVAAEEIVALPPDTRVVIYAQTHALAKAEWEERIPGSLRLMSLGQTCKEGLLTALGGESADCPFVDAITDSQKRGIPYRDHYCMRRCPLLGGCSHWRRKADAGEAKVLVCQHSHLPTMARTGLAEGRVVVIDECAAAHLRTRVTFTPGKMQSFREVLSDFKAAGETDHSTLDAANGLMSEIESVAAGRSRTYNDAGTAFLKCDGFRQRLDAFVSETGWSGWNLFPDLWDLAANRRFVRCTETNGHASWWSVRSNLPASDKPVVVLDATGSRELYEALFPGRSLVVWPEEGATYAPKSDVTVFADGAYCQKSLWDTTIEPNGPSECLTGILDHAAKAIAFHGVAMDGVGVVTLKKLVDCVRERLTGIPGENVLHYGDLRGRNELKDCPMVFVVGCQPPSLVEIAESAVTMFGLDRDPKALVGDVEAQRRFQMVNGAERGFEAKGFSFDDRHMRLAWQALVTAEVAQAAGRSRAHDDRDIVQRVFVFTNVDIGMPATRVLTRREHLRSMGHAGTKAEELYGVIRKLAAEGKPFKYADVSEKSGIPLKSLKAPQYQSAIKQAVADSRLTVSGKPSKFTTGESR